MSTPSPDLPVLPATLALIDADPEYGDQLAQFLSREGVQVTVFRDGNDLIGSRQSDSFGFYVVDPMLASVIGVGGVAGVELIRKLHRRTRAGIVVVSATLAPDLYCDVVAAGADTVLAKPATFAQVASAVGAVQRRIAAVAPSAQAPWQLNAVSHQLIAPDGSCVALSDADVVVMGCLAEACGAPVTRAELRSRLGSCAVENPNSTDGNGLNAVIYRLRRRIERATLMLAPLQSKSRVGYLFRAPLQKVNDPG